MRITGGRARGRVIQAPVQRGVRPTSSRVREALFSMVGHDLTGVTVLDAFGGSGLLGLEAWSRGAEVTVVEKRPRTARVLRETGDALGADWTVVVGDAAKVCVAQGPFDGVLADPPYADDPARWLPILGEAVRHWLVYEAEAKRVAPPTAGPLALDRTRVFGGTALWIYREAG